MYINHLRLTISNNNKRPLILKEKLKILLIVLTNTEFYFYFKLLKKNIDINDYLFKKKLIEFCTENIFSFGLGLEMLIILYVKERTTPLIVYISLIFSFTSCIFVMLEYQISKIK